MHALLSSSRPQPHTGHRTGAVSRPTPVHPRTQGCQETAVCPGNIRVVVQGVQQKRPARKEDKESHASPPTKTKNIGEPHTGRRSLCAWLCRNPCKRRKGLAVIHGPLDFAVLCFAAPAAACITKVSVCFSILVYIAMYFFIATHALTTIYTN